MTDQLIEEPFEDRASIRLARMHSRRHKYDLTARERRLLPELRLVASDGYFRDGKAADGGTEETALVHDRVPSNLPLEAFLSVVNILTARQFADFALYIEHVSDNLTVRIWSRVSQVYGVILVRELQFEVHLVEVALAKVLASLQVWLGKCGRGFAPQKGLWLHDIVLVNIRLFLVVIVDRSRDVPATSLQL